MMASPRTGKSRKIISPKQPSSNSQRNWYPYYAGFTEEFVQEILTTHLPSTKSVLDPWSGSGTTTAACAKRGVSSMGIDLNPALTIVARARMTPLSTKDSLLPLGAWILEAAKDLHPAPSDSDLLRIWLRPTSVGKVRAIHDAIHLILSNEDRNPDPQSLANSADNMPILVCFFYAALFATVRDILSTFRASNPMWLKSPDSHRYRIAISWTNLSERFLDRVQFLRDRLSLESELGAPKNSIFRTASATSLPFRSETFEAAITSPPYATRIDYIKGTLPELAVLGADSTFVHNLRKASTGTCRPSLLSIVGRLP